MGRRLKCHGSARKLLLQSAVNNSVNREIILQGKIFVVDDELANVHLLEKILTRGGYKNLSMTTDSRRFERMFLDDDPDLVLLDLNMPYVDGYKILESLHGLVPEEAFLPVIVLTADARPKAKHRALEGGATDFLTKPFDATEVLLRVGNALRMRFLHRQSRNQNELLEERVRERTQLLHQTISELRRTQQAVTQQKGLPAH